MKFTDTPLTREQIGAIWATVADTECTDDFDELMELIPEADHDKAMRIIKRIADAVIASENRAEDAEKRELDVANAFSDVEETITTAALILRDIDGMNLPGYYASRSEPLQVSRDLEYYGRFLTKAVMDCAA